MRNIFFTLFLFGLISNGFSQGIKTNPLDVREYQLDNGLKVYLNENHTLPIVMGAVAVKGGSKRDPKEATGIAHYLEHMMFKGTDLLGTTDFQAEKVWLDSISMKYDELAKTNNESERQSIQKKINEYSLKAGEYAIPNEFDRVVARMGGTYVNAFTNEDNIVYFNMFPPNQIEKWMMLYSHRFINPVFRLFQSELETVYEEKNMSMDNYFNIMFETFMKNFYKVSPYGQQTVLGSVEHLKNPSLNKMYEYFRTYYVANNMALMISGDFKTEEVIPLIKKYFGVWRSGEIPPAPDYKEKPFNGREFVKVKITPIPVGIMGYRGVPEGHTDQPVIDVISELLFNNSNTGFFNKLYTDNKILMAMMMQQKNVDDGGLIIIFLPKLIKQSLKNAENIVLQEIEKLKKGEFDDTLLNAVKLNLVKYHKTRIEDLRWRPFYFLSCFNTGKPWFEEMMYPYQIEQVTKEQVMLTANKYFGENRLVLYSSMGTPKKQKLQKPPYDLVIPKNVEESSEFASRLNEVFTPEIEPRFIDFKHDVDEIEIREGIRFYHSHNPINDVFDLYIKFEAGTFHFPELDFAARYLSLLGTQSRSFDEFNKTMQALGSTVSFTANRSYFTIHVEGIDKNLEPTLKLLNELLVSPEPNPAHLSKFSQEESANRKTEYKSPDEIGSALKEYALYREKSEYLNRLTIKEIKKLNSDSLLEIIRKAMKYEVEILYCGTHTPEEIKELIVNNISLPEQPVDGGSPIIYKRQEHQKNTIYLLDDKNLIQSQIYIIKEGAPNDDEQRAIAQAFNEYFGGGMNALVFQEIREFRSLAYTARANYYTSFYKDRPGYLDGYLSTQSDKTIEAIEAMVNLMTKMPEKPDRMETIRASLIQGINANYPSFRNIASVVANLRRQGYDDDPNRNYIDIWKKLTFNQIVGFFNENLAEKPLVIVIAGDAKRFDRNKLSQYGEIIELTKKNIFSK